MNITDEGIVRAYDNIYWIYSKKNNIKHISFHTEPYLAYTDGIIPSKLIYTSSKPYGDDTAIQEDDSDCAMYRVAYKYRDDELAHVSDDEIQSAAYKLGLNKAKGIHSNLSDILISDIERIIPTEAFIKRFSNKMGASVSLSVGKEYSIDPDFIKITGGAQINGKSIENQHDLDVVIPILSYGHAQQVWNRIKSKSDGFVIERGFISPMRWISEQSSK